MPAAGKCRKGVLIMKKLLLVVLVPVLVLGLVGCGSSFEEGEPLPYFAQGSFVGQGDADAITLVFTATQLTVLRVDKTTAPATEGTSAFRTGFDGVQVNKDARSFGISTLTLYGFDAGAGEVATVKLSFANDTYTITDVTYDGLAQSYQLPIKGATYQK